MSKHVDYRGYVRTRYARILVLFITFGCGLSVYYLLSAIATLDTLEPMNVTIDPWAPVLRPQSNSSDEMLRMLLPNDGTWADTSQLSRYNRAEVINALKTAQTNASGDRALSIAFLLAVFKEDYEVNKSKLLTAFSECRLREYPRICDSADLISGYLIELSQRGDTSLFTSLFEVSDLADGALAESLGVFFSEQLSQHPQQFLTALRPYSAAQQRSVCELAAMEDGSGMSRDTYINVTQQLKTIAHRDKSSLAKAARRCLTTVTRVNTGRP